MNISIPELALVVLIGPSGSGKSTFARKHFKPTEILSSDFCRGAVSDDENDQSATRDAFEVLHFIARKRLAAGKLTVVDATNVQPEARKPLVALAKEFHCLPVAIVLDCPTKVCQERNAGRSDRDFGPHVIRQQSQALSRSIRKLDREGFRHVFVLDSSEKVEAAQIERKPLWNNLKHLTGPFDIIGDIHGCFDELIDLLGRLGYMVSGVPGQPTARHPDGRMAIFLGDLVDRGPNVPAVLRLVMSMAQAGQALCVPGNHDVKLVRKLKGKDVRADHGLSETLEQLAKEDDGSFRQDISGFLDKLVSHYVLDEGRLVVAHAGLKEDFQGRASAKVREFALYGETTGETDEYGLPVRYNWAAEYRGNAMVVYGHTPVPAVQWVNRTACIDTGCVFGGKLSALRYPEKEIVDVAARATYYEPVKPLCTPGEARPSNARPYPDLLDVEDVIGKRIVSTRIRHDVTIREENAITALEVMSRFAADPKWIIYLPPTMSPSEACREGDFLEHPREVFAYFRGQGVSKVVCEQKHMGSRAVIVLCRNAETAARRFGTVDGRSGIVYTRTGRPFFPDGTTEVQILDRLGTAMEKAGFWERFNTEWICLDSELMPWSAKAQELLRQQYAPVGSASRAALGSAISLLEKVVQRGDFATDLLNRYAARKEMAEKYVAAYRRYCWPVAGVSGLRLAPFHLLATEGCVHIDRDHAWHMETLAELCATDKDLLVATPFMVLDLTDPGAEEEGVRWWLEMTENGGEGMVVKPLDWIVEGKKGLVQPALKCRGREYLRIIYGPEYTAPQHLEVLRARGLSAKRSLALREFALGIEALARFVQREPLYRVHECVFGVLALESEPVDPTL